MPACVPTIAKHTSCTAIGQSKADIALAAGRCQAPAGKQHFFVPRRRCHSDQRTGPHPTPPYSKENSPGIFQTRGKRGVLDADGSVNSATAGVNSLPLEKKYLEKILQVALTTKIALRGPVITDGEALGDSNGLNPAQTSPHQASEHIAEIPAK